ncbi:MAG: carbon-nitrogen hydrolase family protein [Gammaproteobacteria bacterium]
MSRSSITRRQFNKWFAASLLLSGSRIQAQMTASEEGTVSGQSPIRLHVAAIQMVPKLGDAQANVNQAEALVRKALGLGARWIVLPEMFTSGAAFHPDMLNAIQPFEGTPLQLLKDLSREGNAVIGGSFLAKRGQQVFNTFVLVFPDGSVVTHDKDSPTYWENCYYRGGTDDGVMSTPIGPVGSVLCWEFIRSRTARRLANKVKMVVGGSCWWTLPDDADSDNPRRAVNLKMLQDAPVRMARMLGVPVIHGSHSGRFEGFFSPELSDVPYNSAYLGETMIVDADGRVLVRRAQDAGEGVVTAEVVLSSKPVPSEPIPETFWIPKEMPDDWKEAWERWFDAGADYYEMVTAPFIKTGVINEYTPKYLR